MPETLLSPKEEAFAQAKNNAYTKYRNEITGRYEFADNKASVTDFAIIFIDENDLSQDPVIQGRVWAYEDFLKSMGRQQ
jgi:putative NADH-flavin reductase